MNRPKLRRKRGGDLEGIKYGKTFKQGKALHQSNLSRLKYVGGRGVCTTTKAAPGRGTEKVHALASEASTASGRRWEKS